MATPQPGFEPTGGRIRQTITWPRRKNLGKTHHWLLAVGALITLGGSPDYATAGIGSATHLAMAYFNGLAGIDLVHLPLKATGEAINEVISGRAQAVIAASIGALPFAKDSRLRLIGVTSPQRSRYLPEVPTIADSGLPGYQFDSWFGLLGPVGTPTAEVQRVNAAVGKLLKDPVILERLDKQGIEPLAMSPADFGRLLATDYERMAKVVNTSGAKIE